MDREKLKPGAFYWVKPNIDMDSEFFDEERGFYGWDHDYQPARFDGYDDANEERWHLLDVEGTHWGVRWVGPEIVRSDPGDTTEH